VRSTECFRHGLGVRPEGLPAADVFHGLGEPTLGGPALGATARR